MHVRIFTLTLLCLWLAGTASAYDPHYSPFLPGAAPKAFPLQPCAVMKTYANATQAKTTWVLQASRAPGVSLVVRRTEDGNTVSITNRRTGKLLLAPTEIEGMLFGGDALEVSAGLLNEDNKPDFVLLTNSGGCGLGGQCSYRLCMLSVGNAYQGFSMSVFNAGPEDFVDLNRDGRAEMIHTAFVGGGAGKDGRDHNYWVFHLLRFTGVRVVAADRLLAGFPCWICYTFKENHRPTDQLTDQQKIQAWKTNRVFDDICADAKDWPAF